MCPERTPVSLAAQRGFELLNPETRGRPLARRLAIGTAARSARKAQLRPVQAQIEAAGVNTIRIGHEQLEENNREFYENRAVLRKAAQQQARTFQAIGPRPEGPYVLSLKPLHGVAISSTIRQRVEPAHQVQGNCRDGWSFRFSLLLGKRVA
jgi:hypothetical protein